MTAAVLLLTVTGCGSGDSDGDEDAARWRLDHVSESLDTQVHAVAAVSADEGWALATEKGAGDDGRDILLHREGGDWRPVRLPAAMRHEKGAELAAAQLEASAPDNVWLFAGSLGGDGSDTAGLPGAMRWDGRQWHRNATGFIARDAVVLAPDDVWALDASTPEATAHHWDGERWSDHRLPDVYVNWLSASGPDDVWAVGNRKTGPGDRSQPAAVHFDGEKWRLVPTPEYGSAEPKPDEKVMLTEILALAPDDTWAFGQHTYAVKSGAETHHTPIALHWDGSRWRKAPEAVRAPGGNAAPAHSVLAAGDGSGGLVLNDAHGREQHRPAGGEPYAVEEPEPVPGRSDEVTEEERDQQFDVLDLEHVPGTREIWAVGSVGIPPLRGDAAFSRGAIASYSPAKDG
ncbi:hypothetical protein [Streptomyces sp. NPDC048845]|uniref:hypothetical protein n=1 Tax=Streptomyces sp. NPDC048845 TaxID=3155390 RepID=UPI003417F886